MQGSVYSTGNAVLIAALQFLRPLHASTREAMSEARLSQMHIQIWVLICRRWRRRGRRGRGSRCCGRRRGALRSGLFRTRCCGSGVRRRGVLRSCRRAGGVRVVRLAYINLTLCLSVGAMVRRVGEKIAGACMVHVGACLIRARAVVLGIIAEFIHIDGVHVVSLRCREAVGRPRRRYSVLEVVCSHLREGCIRGHARMCGACAWVEEGF
jgi:hypothetical protein